MPSTSDSGRGRGRTYVEVVKHIKPSDAVSVREVRRRSRALGEHLAQTSGGAEAKETCESVNSSMCVSKREHASV